MSEHLDIERVLQRLGIEGKKKGKEWWISCPNPDHDDRSPSCRVRDDPGATKHGYVKCWPCGFGGSVVDLVMTVLGIESVRDARAWLEKEAPVEQREVVGVEMRVRPPSFGFRLPEEVLFGPLEEWPGPARAYATSRGITAEQIERWGIGYAVEGRLRGRIVFVMRDSRGRPRSYSARTFVGDEKRFLDPQASEQASLAAMFGEQHWPPLESRTGAVFVFEGAIKALAAERAMILGHEDCARRGACVAATDGSEARPLHGPKLTTFARICLVGDGDEAGDKISSQLYAQLVRHAEPERLVLPGGADADDLPPAVLRDSMLEWLRRGHGVRRP